ncbi:MAG: transketolase [Alphaproteobacteria bacterium]|nr:transketolase [Alphaproteobacteria bacterium]
MATAAPTTATAAVPLPPRKGSPEHRRMADAIRALAMDAVEAAKSGHPGMPMGMADVATVLWTRFLKHDPSDPAWPDRDRFVLSAGHGSMLLYALLHLTGYPGMTIEELKRFRQSGSRTPGHPEYGHAPGVETTTGPLGQGLANAVGMALAERLTAARFGADLVDHRTYVIAGDGCLMEGISQEAISLAGHLKLSKLVVLFDDNGISIDGPTSLSTSEDQQARFRAAGWSVQSVDGHDPEAVAKAIEAARGSDKPNLIACRTIIGYGAPSKAGSASSHGSPLGAGEIAGARAALGWTYGPFEVPEDLRKAWLDAGQRARSEHAAWSRRHAGASQRAEFDRAMAGRLPADWRKSLDALVAKWIVEKPKLATRQASGDVLEALNASIPELIGGSADLTGSNNTKTKAAKAVAAADGYAGRYVYWGVREHGMAAAMNGMALHGGVIPYSGTFLVFTDYCRPSIRLAALMGLRVIYVMTHDSIGLGEDGPTHQPIEHLASLRAIPNLLVMRPGDAVETAECWAVALERRDGPTVLALTRQALAPQRIVVLAESPVARGAYVLSEAQGKRKATIVATGSEVEIAVAARSLLQAKGIGVRVVSMPCTQLFDAQPQDERDAVLPPGEPVVAVEAAIGYGWERYTGSKGRFVGMQGFGASAPYQELYKQFGITPEAVAQAVVEAIG